MFNSSFDDLHLDIFLVPAWTVTHLIMINEWFSIIRSFITYRKAHQECWMTSMTVVTAPPKYPQSQPCVTPLKPHRWLTSVFRTQSAEPEPARSDSPELACMWLPHVVTSQRSDGSETRLEGQGEATPQPLIRERRVRCEAAQVRGWSRQIYCSCHPSSTCRIKPNLVLNPNRQMLTYITDSNRLDFTSEPAVTHWHLDCAVRLWIWFLV